MVYWSYLVYRLECTAKDGTVVVYFGITGVLLGQTEHAALMVRRRFHELYPKSCLGGATDLKLSVEYWGLKLLDALVEEVSCEHVALDLLVWAGFWGKKSIGRFLSFLLFTFSS